MEEIWKDISGYEGLYQVSNFGNVKSLNWRRTGKPKNLYLKAHNRGYLQVELAKNGVKKSFMVHRLVAEAFIKNPNGFPVINHKDEDKTNNCVNNLEWCDLSYNVLYFLSLRTSPRYRRGKNTNYKVVQCSLDGKPIKVWDSSRVVFIKTGMSDWSISECCRGNRKTAYGYKWQYAN